MFRFELDVYARIVARWIFGGRGLKPEAVAEAAFWKSVARWIFGGRGLKPLCAHRNNLLNMVARWIFGGRGLKRVIRHRREYPLMSPAGFSAGVD